MVEKLSNEEEMIGRINNACAANFGVLESSFLCKSLSALALHDPISVSKETKVSEAINLLQQHKRGCLAVTNEQGQLVGIFTERDCVLKVVGTTQDYGSVPISDVMTPNPVAQKPDCTVAFALNLMSSGGFRHIPIVDDDNHPIGMLSVKDVVDYLVGRMMDDLVEFETVAL